MNVWIDGAVVDAREARVSPFDHGLLTGDGVFETLKVYAGRPFAVRRHLERLARSAAGLGLVLPEASVLRAALDELVARNGERARRRSSWRAVPSGAHRAPPTSPPCPGRATSVARWPA